MKIKKGTRNLGNLPKYFSDAMNFIVKTFIDSYSVILSDCFSECLKYMKSKHVHIGHYMMSNNSLPLSVSTGDPIICSSQITEITIMMY